MEYTVGDVASLLSKNGASKTRVEKPFPVSTNSNEDTDDTDSESDAVEAEESSINCSSDESMSEDEEPNAEDQLPKNKEQPATKKPSAKDNEEHNKRTIFVGNVPICTSKTQLRRLFKKYGQIETIRIRSVPVKDMKMPKKVAARKKDFHPDRTSFNAYIRFVQEEFANKALDCNGFEYKGHHLRVNNAAHKASPTDNTKHAVFVGNLKFDAEEDDLWNAFEICGQIATVRIIRDPQTSVGKGFGYVNFTSSDSVELALQMEDVKVKGREVRIKLCSDKPPGKPKKKHEARNKLKNKNREAYNKRVAGKNQTGTPGGPGKPKVAFEGRKFTDKKKKRKPNKGLQQKKQIARKIQPKAT